MLGIGASRTTLTDTDITITVNIVAPPDSEGIFDWLVVNTDGTTLLGPFPVGCARSVFRELTFQRVRVPVSIQASECTAGQGRGPITSTGPLFAEDAPQGQMRVLCQPIIAAGGGYVPATNNQACIDAQGDLRSLRNEILTRCGEASATRGRRNAFAAVAAPFYVGAGVVIGTGFSWLSAVVAVVLFAVAVVFTILSGVQQNALATRQVELARLRRQYADGVRGLSRVCCPEFITVDQDVPACP